MLGLHVIGTSNHPPVKVECSHSSIQGGADDNFIGGAKHDAGHGRGMLGERHEAESSSSVPQFDLLHTRAERT